MWKALDKTVYSIDGTDKDYPKMSDIHLYNIKAYLEKNASKLNEKYYALRQEESDDSFYGSSTFIMQCPSPPVDSLTNKQFLELRTPYLAICKELINRSY